MREHTRRTRTGAQHARSASPARRRRSLPWALALALLAAPLLGAPAGAANFLVNNNNDAGDNSIGDGDCWTGGFVFVGMFGVFECTLRAAIQETNALIGPDTIGFSSLLNPNVFGTVVISVTSPLPNITSPVTIDGTTDQGFPPGFRPVGPAPDGLVACA